MKNALASWFTIIVGLTAMLFMVAIVFPALLVWALIERTRIDAEAEFDETGAPILPEIDKARKAHEAKQWMERNWGQRW